MRINAEKMTSTQYSIGMSGDRSSSRVLKPPGGGHTNIFGESEVHVPSPRPKYDQQNSSNLNFCMNTVDPNLKVELKKPDVVKSEPAKPAAAADAGPKPSTPPAAAVAAAVAPSPPASANGSNGHAAPQASIQSDGGQARGNSRVPPGGFSSGGFW